MNRYSRTQALSIIEAIKETDQELTEWEEAFMMSIQVWTGSLTDWQSSKLTEIYEKVSGVEKVIR